MALKYRVGMYHYEKRGSSYVIYQCTHVSENGGSSSPVHGEPSYFNKEDARRRVYELNGWKLK